jgi:hypothetical protein
MMGSLVEQLHGIARLIRAFIAAPLVPQLRIRPQIFPLAAVSHRYSMADITAEGFAVWIKTGTFQPAINIRRWGMKMVVKTTEINRRFAAHASILPE